MRPNVKQLLCTIGLMVTLSMMIGCGSSDLLDEETTRYSVYIDPVASDGETIIHEVDVVRSECAEGDDDTDPDVVEQPGLLFPFDVRATVEADLTAAEIVVESYDFALTPVSGTFGGVQGTEIGLTRGEMPNLTDTTLNPRSTNTSSQVVLPGGSVDLDLLIWSAGDKDLYVTYLDTFPPVTDAGYAGRNTVFTYNVEVTLHCRDIEDNTFTLTGETFVTFGSYVGSDECQQN